MADEDMTREVLFPDWESPDKTGLTIEHASTGEMFVKEVKGESPAARSGKVYEGDQIVGATIYFDKMKPEDTAEVMKVLARHKVGLKLQNKADKSPCNSPLSTPCRSPIGTLTWEGRTSFGGSSPDIVLSGDDEDYRRIYTKKIKPRLKSEDLAEGVDVRTERHSSTSNDGSTITTITRRITTYMVDLPGDSEKLELSSPEQKGLRLESGDSSPAITIFRGNLSGKVGAEEGVFDSSDLSYTGPQGLTAEKQWCAGKVETRTIIREGKEKCSDLQYKGSAFRVTDSEGAEILKESAEQEGESILTSKTSTALSDSTKTADSRVTIGGSEAAKITSADKNGQSGNWPVPEKDMQIGISVKGKTNMGANFDDKTKVSTSENVISHLEKKGAGITDSGSSGDSAEVRLPITLGNVINVPNTDTDIPRFKIPSFGSKCQKVEEKEAHVKVPTENITIKKAEVDINKPDFERDIENTHKKGNYFNIPIGSGKPTQAKVDKDLDVTVSKGKEDVNTSTKDREVTNKQTKGLKDSFNIPKFKIQSFSKNFPGDDKLNVEMSLQEENINRAAQNIESIGGGVYGETPENKIPNIDYNTKGKMFKNGENTMSTKRLSSEMTEGDIKAPVLDIKAPEEVFQGTNIGVQITDVKKHTVENKDPNLKKPDIDIKLKSPKVEGDLDIKTTKTEGDITAPDVDISGVEVDIEGLKGGLKMPKFKMPTFGSKSHELEGQDVNVNLTTTDIEVKAPDVDINAQDVDIEGPDARLKGPKFTLPKISGPNISMPDVDFNLKGPKLKGDIDASLPKTEGEIKTPDLDVKGPEVDIDVTKPGFEMPKVKMPSLNIKGPKMEKPDVDIKLKGPKLGGDLDVKAPKIKGDITAPDVDIGGVELDIEGPKGPGFEMPKVKLPTVNFKGSKFEKPDADIKPKGLKSGGDLDDKALKIKGDIKAPEVSGIDISLTAPDPKIKTPVVSVGAKGSTTEVNFQQSEDSVDTLDTDVNVKGKKGKFKLGKGKGKWKKAEADTKLPAADLGGGTTHSLVKETKTKKHLFGKIHFPDVELDIKSPKMKGEGTLAEGVKSSKTDLVSPGLSTAFDGSGTVDANVCLEGSDVKVSTSDVKMTNKGGLEASASGGGLRYPEGKLTFSKIRMPKFGILKTNSEGQDSDHKVKSEVLSSGDKNTHSQSASPKQSHSEGKIKVKKPNFFGKSKAKGSTGDLHGTDIESGASGQMYKGSTELCAPSYDSGKFEMEGTSELSVSTKSKSASLDLLKKPRHRSSSHSDEESPATSSPSVPLEAEACDVSLDLGVNKVKGKKSKLKFGTFGGFGSKSKGSYEVTLGGENETGMEGSSSVSTPSKKSRLSSSSSSDSGSRAGFKFPKLELSVSPKK